MRLLLLAFIRDFKSTLVSIRNYLSTGENRIRVITRLRNQEKDIIV